MSRTKNSIKNSIVSMVYNLIVIGMTFITQSIFIRSLGAEYNGVKSLFHNIITILSVVELGFTESIIFSLYKPVQENDKESIKSILHFFKKTYRLLGVIIIVLGIALLPFIYQIVGNTSIQDNLTIVFLLYLFDTSITYFLSYRTSLLYADQKNRYVDANNAIWSIIKNIAQILVLLTLKNFILFIVIQILYTILSNALIYRIVGKKYSFIDDKNVHPIPLKTKNDIKKRIKGLFFHRIGGAIVTSTDNLLIASSKELGISYVGYYNNYYLIIYNVGVVFNGIISSLTTSIGNLIIDKDSTKDKIKQTYKSITMASIWIYCFGATAISCMIEPFIKLWLGDEYILPEFVLSVLVINFFINGLKRPNHIFKNAAGIFYEDKHVPIIESIVNLVASIILMQIFGLAGVFLGTICSSVVLLFYSYPLYMYKKIIDDKLHNYFIIMAKYTVISIIAYTITSLATSFINIGSTTPYIELIKNGIICILLPNIIFYLFVFKTTDYKYLVQKLKRKQ